MRRTLIPTLLAAVVSLVTQAQGQNDRFVGSPSVSGPAERFSQPTRAQSAQTWRAQESTVPFAPGRDDHSGRNGRVQSADGDFHCTGGGYFFSPGQSWFRPPFVWYGGAAFVYVPPTVFQGQPASFQPLATGSPQFQEWIDENRRAWHDPLETFPIEQLPRRFIKPSSTEARLQSMRLQHLGDLSLKNLQYGTAAGKYEQAIAAAPDRADPYFRLGIAEAARSRFDVAVRQFKLGLQLDTTWASTGATLDELLGAGKLLPKTEIKQRIVDWTWEDIRDPDRLFLLGVIQHLDGDAESARVLFETAARLGGMKEHLAAFLRTGQVAANPAAQPTAVEPPPPALKDAAGNGPGVNAPALPPPSERAPPPPPRPDP
jgi:hypothetical protein